MSENARETFPTGSRYFPSAASPPIVLLRNYWLCSHAGSAKNSPGPKRPAEMPGRRQDGRDRNCVCGADAWAANADRSRSIAYVVSGIAAIPTERHANVVANESRQARTEGEDRLPWQGSAEADTTY
jgi:hypothetical protein